MGNTYVVPLKDAVTGVLHGKAGTFRVLIDEDISDCWYILSGHGTMYIADESFELGPEMAVFAPADTMHKIDVGPDEDLTYVLIYAPPGPEKLLKAHGEHAFDKK